MVAHRASSSYSISSILLLIFGIVFGGILFSVQKTSEILLPLESNGSGSTLATPIAAAPTSLPPQGFWGNQLTSSVIPESSTPLKKTVKSQYYINPKTSELKLVTNITPTSDEEYFYLQCWTWSGQWDLRVDAWKQATKDPISLFTLDTTKPNNFACRTYTYTNGTLSAPEWVVNGGIVQEYVVK